MPLWLSSKRFGLNIKIALGIRKSKFSNTWYTGLEVNEKLRGVKSDVVQLANACTTKDK